ncbi:hypothetical protein TRVA0_047S00188 [Trichomonascus vanleenenianus]|uniref:uncharacterized protein n=1 Tax=Trichomonascus vanleenenianus TaxID=2268995 RepID=UPI003EC96F7E
MSFQPVAEHSFGREYVLGLAAVGSHGLLASLSDHSLHLLPFDPIEIKTVGTPLLSVPKAHASTIQAVKTFDANTAASCAADGVKLWDLRTKSTTPVAVFTNEQGSPFASLDTRGTRIGAGTELVGVDAGVVLWDARKGSVPIQSYMDPHYEDVTVVQFHPSDPNGLLSGGQDGYVNVYNTSIDDMDDAVYQTINHGAAVHLAGFLPGNDRKIYVKSNMETFSVYQVANPDEEVDEPKPVDFGDIREKWGCEYVADVTDGYIACGSNSANQFKLLRYDNDEGLSGETVVMDNGHGEEVVRAVCLDRDRQLIYTGGEDGRVVAWRSVDYQLAPSVQKTETITEDDNGWEEVSSKKKKKSKSKEDKDKKKKKKSDKRQSTDGKRYKPY